MMTYLDLLAHVLEHAARKDDLTGTCSAVYFQQPRYYFFPELPQIQFYDRSDFPRLDAIDAHSAVMPVWEI
jgi:hypothetical protein